MAGAADSILDQRDTKSAEERWKTLRSAYLNREPAFERQPAVEATPALEVTVQDAALSSQQSVVPSSQAQSIAPKSIAPQIEWEPIVESTETSEADRKSVGKISVPVRPAIISRSIVSTPSGSDEPIDATRNEAPLIAPANPTERESDTFVDLGPAPELLDWPSDTVAPSQAPSTDSLILRDRFRVLSEPAIDVPQSVPSETTAELPPKVAPFQQQTGDMVTERPAAIALLDIEAPATGPDISHLLPLKPLNEIVPSADYATESILCNVSPSENTIDDDCPDVVLLPERGEVDRMTAEIYFHWAASNVTYNPLYFEDARLERYGQHVWEPIQSLKSVGLFAGQFASLPYQLALDPVHEEVSPLGFYRPGEAAPCLKRPMPFNGKAMGTAVGAYTGAAFLIP